MDFVTEIIEKVKTAIAQSKMTKEERAEAKKNLAELERIKELYTNAYKAAEKAVAERTSDTKSTNNLENKTNQEYNSNINHSLKNNGKNKSEQYGVMWTLGEGVLDNNEVSAFYEKISETKNSKYHNYHKAADGQLIYEINNKLIYTDGDYGHPHISKVVAFNTNDTYLLEYGRESFYDGEKYGYQTEAVVEVIEAVLGEGAVQTTTYSSYETNKRSGYSGRKGKDSTATNRRGQNYVDNNSHNYSLKNTSQISRRDVEDVQSIGRKSVNDFSKDDIKKAEVFARKYYQEMGEKSPFFRAWFGDWRANDTQMLSVVKTKKDVRGPINNKDTGWDINNSSKLHNELHNNVASIIGREYLPFANDIIENAVLLDSVISDKGGNSVMFHSFYAIARKETDTNNHLVKLLVEELYNPNGDTIKRGYKLIGFKEISPTVQKVHPNNGLASSLVSDNFSVADLFNFVKLNDKDFNPKPASVVVNKDGTPKVVYHGSSENFTAFDITKSRSWNGEPDYDLPGFYFSENKEDSALYGNVKEYYINITNPYEGDIYALAKEKGSWRNAYEYLIKEGYDGVIDDEFGEGSYEYIVLKAENIKSATDNIGTFDKSNPDVSFSLKGNENIATVKKLIQSIQGRRGLRYDGGRVIRIPNNDMETLRHKFMTEHHYSNRSGGIIDCIDCFGEGGKKHYFYIFYVGEDNRVAPIFRLDYEYIERYLDDVQKISKEMGYNKDEFVNATSGNGKGIDRIRNLAKSDSVYDVSSAGEGTNSRSGKIYNNESGRRKTDNRHNDSGISNGYNDPSNSGEIDEKASNSLKGGVSNTKLLDTIEGVQKGKKEAVDTLSKYAESGIISTELYGELIEKYGAISKGEKPYRDIQVPRKTEKDKKVS